MIKEVNLEQQIAANPDLSIWLHASAGTGKTKVLTDRLLRLLIKGVGPGKILCLTFTNAAANEMYERIYQKISTWATTSDAELKIELQNLGCKHITSKEIWFAKNLLLDYLKKDDNLNIYTIHSFCQKILQRFPLEAGISPNFKILDEINKPQIISHIKRNLVQNKEILDSIGLILRQVHETKLNELIIDILNSQIKFKNFFSQCSLLGQYKNYLSKILTIEIFDENEIIIEIYNKILDILGSQLKKLVLSDDPTIVFSKLQKVFLTQDGQKKKKLFAKNFASIDIDLILEASNIVYEGFEKIKTLKIFNSCLSFYNLAHFIILEYESCKKQKGYLDYDDLIYHTKSLLTKSEFKDWILYKLDGGIEHILIDEAQDTSLHQWDLIMALINDFISRQEDDKSIFVVGDEKQSIYSFQGAIYEYFDQTKKKILQDLVNAKKKHQMLNLKISYRSSEVILDIVSKVFHHIRNINNDLFNVDNFELRCHHKAYGGSFELWHVHTQQDHEEKFFWPVFSSNCEQYDPKKRLAKDIASYILNQIKSKKILFSTQKPVNFGDFMILLRQRGGLAQEIVSELKKLRIPVSDLDKMLLSDDLSIQDLLAAAKFSLFPEDELNLACLLRSPIFDLNEEMLHRIAYKRCSNLYLQIQTNSEYLEIKNKLDKIEDLANSVNIASFFHILVYGYNNLEKFIACNGQGVIDSVGNLISLAVKFEQEVSSSMQDFISWQSSYNLEVSKDSSHQNVVKIMTVHGAKGLQAPIIILPDTTSVPKSDDKFFWNYDDYPFFAVNANQHNAFYKKLKSSSNDLLYKEYLRLLYVALTRSQEQLVICGFSSHATSDPHSWHSIIFNAVANDLEFIEEAGIKKVVYKSRKQSPIMSFVTTEIPFEPVMRIVADKEYSVEKNEMNLEHISPLKHNYATFYGQIIHKILEDALQNKDLNILFSHILFALLSVEYVDFIKKKFAILLQNPEFTELLDGLIKAEVCITDNFDYNFGRIDLLVIKEDKVFIIDYKTDAKVPGLEKEIPFGYLEQLRNYKRMIQKIYPDKKIEAKILWLSEPKFMLIN